MSANTGLLRGECNLFGSADQGPRHLVGGMYGPEHNGEVHWHCGNPPVGRFRMHCRFGHKGQIMQLCADHAGPDGIPKRMAGLCPACAWPTEARDLDMESRQVGLRLGQLPAWAQMAPGAIRMRRRLEEIKTRMDELTESGAIKKVPLELREVA